MTEASLFNVHSAASAATTTARALGLDVDEAIVVHASNRVALRLMPCDVLAHVAAVSHGAAQLEVDLATQLARTGAPIVKLDPRVPAGVHERDGWLMTFWTYYETRPSGDLAPAAYARALFELHAGLRTLDLPTPHVMDRVREAEALVRNALPPSLSGADRELLVHVFATVIDTIRQRSAGQQLLHGEPHPGNVLNTRDGPLFIDLETCCRGPVEFDLAHVPRAVSDAYPDVDQALVGACRVLVLAMAAAWRFDPGDRLPHGGEVATAILAALRAGAPYPAISAIPGLD